MKKNGYAIFFLMLLISTWRLDGRADGADYGSGRKTVDTADYILYIPKGLESQKRYPLIIALHPGADARSMIELWKGNSERHRWIIFASKRFSNGQDTTKSLQDLVSILKGSIFERYPVDMKRIAATGFSGGGMGSHGLSFEYPELVSAVIVNTCMIHRYYYSVASKYPQGKMAIFLASPTDFRYNEMKSDCGLLGQKGWKTKWIEFEGGHRIAPAPCYDAAADWLEAQWRK